jgi:hypothetical protein
LLSEEEASIPSYSSFPHSTNATNQPTTESQKFPTSSIAPINTNTLTGQASKPEENLSPLDKAHFDSFVKSTVEEDGLNGASLEHKEIPSIREDLQIDQDHFVKRQIHEVMFDQERCQTDDSLMTSRPLIDDHTPEAMSEDELEEIKKVATDFVKSLSQEALEIVKEKNTEQQQQKQQQQQQQPIPKVKVTFSTEVSDTDLISDMTELKEELFGLDTRDSSQVPVSSSFKFQTSFRSHFVAHFDSEEEADNSVVTAESRFPLQNGDGRFDNGFTAEKPESQNGHSKNGVSGSFETKQTSSRGGMVESSEDIWAGEDAVMLRKSMTTFSIKSMKSESDSTPSELKHQSSLKSDRLSGTDQDCSSGDAYHTAHGSTSRPSSSDVDQMLSAVSGRGSSMTTTTEYETANSHTDFSQHSSSYHTAASTFSSKSLSSAEKSGNLASIEHSEASDTLIDVSMEHDRDEEACTPSDELAFDDEEPSASSQLVRSPEMMFTSGEIIKKTEEPIEDELQPQYVSQVSLLTISSASDTGTVVAQEAVVQHVTRETKEEIETMQKSTLLTESTSSTTSEKAIHSCTLQTGGSGDIISSIEELKKDESPLTEKVAGFLSKVVSFDTSTLSAEITVISKSLKDQKSFDSEFGSRPESELKDFVSRPHSISDAMLGDNDSLRPESQSDVSDTEMDQLRRNQDPFPRPESPEPPLNDNSPMDEQAVKTEVAFSTHFTQVIEDEDEEYEKMDEVPEYKIMTAVEIDPLDYAHNKLRGTQSFDMQETSPIPTITLKPLGTMVWPASADLNLKDDDDQAPVGKSSPLCRSESEDDESSSKLNLELEDKEVEDRQKWIETEDHNLEADGSSGEFQGFLYNPPLDQIIEEEEEAQPTEQHFEAAQLKELKDLKESLNNTPEFDMMSERRTLSLKLGQKENSSMSSLNEFEVLENQVIQHGSGSGSRGSMGSEDSLEAGPTSKIIHKKTVHRVCNDETGSRGSSGSLQEFEQMEDACLEAGHVEDTAKQQEVVLSEIEEGHESQISESESCETLSQGGKSDDSTEFTQRMHQIDEIIRQAQSNVETFDTTSQYAYAMSRPMENIMEASTDSLDPPKKEQNNSMVTSSDSLEDKFQHSSIGDDVMKISTDSIEMAKSTNPQEFEGMMMASTDSLESGTGTTSRTTASMLSSCASNTSSTLVSESDHDRSKERSFGLEKLTESDESSVKETCTTVTTSQCRVSYGFNVSEVILPSDEGGLTSTIERTVEMPAEVTKIQFKGPDAETKMQEYVLAMSGGQSLQEVESVDASGNVIHKKVIQQRGGFDDPSSDQC